MTKLRHVAFLALFVGLPWTPASAAGNGQPSALDTYLARRIAQDKFSGTVLLAKDGKIVFEKSTGDADIEHHVALTPDMPMRIGSLTKPVTAVAVMRAIEDGKFALDTLVCTFLATCPDGWQKVTIRNLLTHTSGLPDLFQALPAVPVEQTVAEVDKVLKTPAAKPVAPAGSAYSYNNFGYVLLGYVLEKTEAMAYPQIMQKLVFDPAGMTDATYDYPDRIIANRVRGYVRKDGVPFNTIRDPAAYAAGGLLLSGHDFLHFEQALFQGTLLKPESRALLFEPPAGNNYGLGWQAANAFGRTVYQHNGETHGASASFIFVPADNVWLHVLSNFEDVPTHAYACDMLAAYYGANYPDPTRTARTPPEPDFAGTYKFGDGTVRDIVLKDGALNYAAGGQPQALEPLAPGLYAFAVDESVRLEFHRTATGVTLNRTRCGSDAGAAVRA
jgi:CubicO group peptidase (beta-lactamase class C family)